MVKFFQELFPWLATLPFAAKFLVSFAILLVAVAILVLMWTPPPTKSEETDKSLKSTENKNTTDISSTDNKTPETIANTQQEITPSPIATPKSSPTIPVASTPEPKESPKPMYPKDKTLEGLRRLLDKKISKQNKQILLEIARAGVNGLYIFDIEKKFKLSRNDVAQRAEVLQKSELIEIEELTDKNFRLHENIWEIIGPNGNKLLETMLK